MKKQLIKCLVISISILSILSCKKDDKKDGTPTPTSTLKLASSDAVSQESNYAGGNSDENSFFIRYFPNDTIKSPLIIVIHGGGFTTGDRRGHSIPLRFNLDPYGNGINIIEQKDLDLNRFAFASINYRLLDQNKNLTALNCLTDGEDFLNYIIDNAQLYNIDPKKIIFIGSSGGAEMALWIGLQEQKRHNNAVKGIVALNAQASMNIYKWREQVFAPFNATSLFDAAFTGANVYSAMQYSKLMYGSMNPVVAKKFADDHNLHLLDLITSDDPEIYLACGVDPWGTTSIYDRVVHGGYHDWAILKRSNERNHNTKVNYVYGNPFYKNPNYESVINFCIRKLQ